MKSFRKISSIDINSFCDDIVNSSLYSNPASTVSEFSEQFSTVVGSILDKHAPLKTVECRSRPTKPFINSEILLEKSKRSHLESILRKNHTDENRSKYKAQSKLVSKMVTAAKRRFFRNATSQNKSQPKKLWKTFNTLLHINASNVLPSNSTFARRSTGVRTWPSVVHSF